MKDDFSRTHMRRNCTPAVITSVSAGLSLFRWIQRFPQLTTSAIHREGTVCLTAVLHRDLLLVTLSIKLQVSEQHFAVRSAVRHATMIFDTDLAAAARRHARAQAKLKKQSQMATEAAEGETNQETSPEKSTGTNAGSVAAASANSELETPADSNSGVISEGSTARFAKTSQTTEVAPAGGESVAVSGFSGSRKNSAANGDMDGMMRVGPVAPRPRSTMKPRVLLKIIVLGCSNVSRVCPQL